MPVGSLEEMLHRVTGNSGPARSPLDWKQRSAISLAVARGVASIHSAGPSSIHGNIKSSNILLTGTHSAVVSEHGLMTLVGPLRNSWGNRAPEDSGSIRQVSQKDDVFSFGLLLLELLTGKPRGMAWKSGSLAAVREVVRDGGLAMALANKVVGWGQARAEEKGIVQLLQVAMDCCSECPPEMSAVVQAIEKIP